MRTHLPKLMLLGVGGGIAAYLFSRTRSASLLPDDPVQSFDQLNPVRLEDLDVDAMSMVDAEVDIDLATVESSLDEGAMELDTPGGTTLDGIEQSLGDVGDLYGAHMPRAQVRALADDDTAMADGQTWVEALEASAAENGPAPEQPLIVDDEDRYPPPSASEDDTPVADRGSGGPGGI